VTLDIELVSGQRINRIIEVQDLERQAWRGLFSGVHLSARRENDGVNRSMQLTIEREADDDRDY
jgi:hypothetical protein